MVLVGFHGFSSWFHGFSWFLVGFHGFSRWFHGFSWVLVGFHGFSWFLVGFHGFQGGFMVYHGFWLVPMVLLVENTTKQYPGPTIQSRPCRPQAGFGLVQKMIRDVINRLFWLDKRKHN